MTFTDILKNHDGLLGHMTDKIVGLTNDVHALEERTCGIMVNFLWFDGLLFKGIIPGPSTFIAHG